MKSLCAFATYYPPLIHFLFSSHILSIDKDPVFSNGRITRFDLRIQELRGRRRDHIRNASVALESVHVNRSREDNSTTYRDITELKEIRLPDNNAVKVFVTAVNAVGRSPEAELAIATRASRE